MELSEPGDAAEPEARGGPGAATGPMRCCGCTSTGTGTSTSSTSSSSGMEHGRRGRRRRQSAIGAAVTVAAVAIAVVALQSLPSTAFWIGRSPQSPAAAGAARRGRRAAAGLQPWSPSPPPAAAALRPSRLAAATAYSDSDSPDGEEDVLERIQAAVSLADVVRRYTEEMEDKGDGEYMCRCLFHEDRKPSMSVTAAKGLYHCFSCGASGNLFKFVSEMEGLTFREAVVFLADEAGIELPPGGSFSPGKDYSRLHQALEAASEYYASVLSEAPGGLARSHLRERKTSPALAAEFQLGFSPPVPGGLWERLEPLNFTQEELVGSGLFSPKALQVLRLPPAFSRNQNRNATAAAAASAAASSGDDGDGDGDAAPAAPALPARRLPFDRMGGRLVIPIRNARGQMVGFSGRLLLDEPLAKYVNTPETAIFKKRTLLYGLHRARAAIRETGRAIVVEGFFDVISLHGVGVRCRSSR